MTRITDITQDTAATPPAAASEYLDLINSISHDLRSNFSVMSGLISLLPLASDDTERDDMLRRLRDNTRQALHIFTNLQNYVQHGAGLITSEKDRLQPDIFFESVRKKWLRPTEEQQTTLTITGPAGLIVTADKENLLTITDNVVFYTLYNTRATSLDFNWGLLGENGWFCRFTYTGDPLPPVIGQSWNATGQLAGWQDGDDISLRVALQFALLMGAKTSVTNDAGSTETCFAIHFE